MGQLVSTSDSPKTLTLPIGAASPLWLAFSGAASAGVAYWWMTRWARSPQGPAAASVVLEAPAVAETLELKKADIEAPVNIAEPVASAPAPVETLAAAEFAASPPAEAPVIKKTVAKAPKPAKATAAKVVAPEPVVAKPVSKPKLAKIVVAEAKVESAAPKAKAAPRKPATKRSAKTV